MNVHETRIGRDGRAYDAIIPIQRASEQTYTRHVADTLREWLHRSGAPNEALSDSELLALVRAAVIESG